MTNTGDCTCPMERLYSHHEVCGYCREVVFFDDEDYAYLMGFSLVDGVWIYTNERAKRK